MRETPPGLSAESGSSGQRGKTYVASFREASGGLQLVSTMRNKALTSSVAILVLGLGGCLGQRRLLCDPNALETCMEPFSTAADAIQVGIEVSEVEIDKLCGEFNDTVTCAEEAVVTCPEQVQGVWTSIKDGFSYLCTEPGKSLYLAHAACLRSNAVQENAAICNGTFIGAQRNLSRSGLTDPMKIYRRTCRYINSMIDCTTFGIYEECGTAAAMYQLTLTTKLLSGSIGTIGCTIKTQIPDDETTEPAPSTAAQAGSLTSMLVSVTTAVFALMC